MKYKFINGLEKGVADKLVTKRKHPEHDLYIYNYTASAMSISPSLWPEWLMDARGLVLDSDGWIWARPFRKFWNLDLSDQSKWNQSFTVTEKMDGSLIIAFQYGDKTIVASRGSFTSDQAKWASAIMEVGIRESIKNGGSGRLAKDKTILFELIHPENQIVVNYGNKKELIFLASIYNNDGLDVKVPIFRPFDAVNQYKFDSIQDLVSSKQDPNREGYVIRFEDGTRAKFKFEQYVALHRVRFSTSNRTIWETAKLGADPLDFIPEEDRGLRDWASSIYSRLIDKHQKLVQDACLAAFHIGVNVSSITGGVGSDKEFRKLFAIESKKRKYPQLLFNALDGRDDQLAENAWKICYPETIEYYKKEASE